VAFAAARELTVQTAPLFPRPVGEILVELVLRLRLLALDTLSCPVGLVALLARVLSGGSGGSQAPGPWLVAFAAARELTVQTAPLASVLLGEILVELVFGLCLLALDTLSCAVGLVALLARVLSGGSGGSQAPGP